jgi:hypothetical protein
MSHFYESIRSERHRKSLTGLARSDFERLVESFSESLEEIKLENYQQNRHTRNRKPGGGQKGKLSTPKDKLFFILYYLKVYPTFDNLGFIFGLSFSKASENVTK